MKNSPLNELTAQDIARKQKKLDRIDKRIDRKDDKFKAKVASGKKGTDMDITRHERSLGGLKERKHKTEHQIETGERGRPTSLRNEAWVAGTSRKSSSPVNNYKDGYYGVERKSALNMLGISPLNDMTQQENDSIAAVKAWDKFKSGYMNRTTHPATGKPIDSTYNQKEYDMEKNEFYYDTNKSKMRLIPTDDGEVQDEDFKSKLKKWQLPPQK